jgi:hypothetical protein
VPALPRPRALVSQGAGGPPTGAPASQLTRPGLALCHRAPPPTGALKSGFTRTGKRTLGGLVDDGVKSCVRYYLNNFRVGRDGLGGEKEGFIGLFSGGPRRQQHRRL